MLSRWPITRHEVLRPPGAGGRRRDAHLRAGRHRRSPRPLCRSSPPTSTGGSTRATCARTRCGRSARFIAEVTPRPRATRSRPSSCGDFNAAPDSDEIRMLTGRAATPEPKLVFHDAWEVAGGRRRPGMTWTNANPYARLDLEPDRRIDYVLVGWPKAGGAGHVTSCAVDRRPSPSTGWSPATTSASSPSSGTEQPTSVNPQRPPCGRERCTDGWLVRRRGLRRSRGGRRAGPRGADGPAVGRGGRSGRRRPCRPPRR